MEPYEATKFVFSRIQGLDPENASKIMGLLLIQDHGEKEMIRLAFGPENLLHSVVVKARLELGITPSSSTPSTPSSPSPSPSPFPSNNNPLSLSRQNSNNSNSSRFHPSNLKVTVPTLSSPSSNCLSPSWGTPDDGVSSGLNPSTLPFYSAGDLMDEIQLQEQLSFLNDGNSGGDSGTYNWNGLPHRRSSSVNDINLGSSLLDDPASGLGWKPCLYFARGFCKNGSSCRFIHGGGDSDALVGSPSKLEVMEQCHELLRSKSLQHHKLMAAMASTSPTFPFSVNKGLGLFDQSQQNDSPRSAAALMMGDELQKFSRARLDNGNGRGLDSSPASRQIYLTFPADSTFREEDVSNYFSIYGPVQDVRIPYQQKRMFGFVTFVYPETVKIILAKGNPHFVCDARVLVKPYKEKGKVPEKFRKQQQHQQMGRGEFSACNSPTALESRDPFDLQLGSRMMYDTQQYMIWRRKLEEQANLQQALELQSRRLMGLQLFDVKRNNHHRSHSTGAPIPSSNQSPNSIFSQPLLGSDRSSPDAPDDNCASPPLHDAKQALQQAINESTDREKEGSVGEDSGNFSSVKEGPCLEDNILPESLEHNLPDNPFVSPTKGAGEYITTFCGDNEAENALTTLTPAVTSTNHDTKSSSFLPPTSTLDLPPFKSCYFQMPRFSPGHGAIGM